MHPRRRIKSSVKSQKRVRDRRAQLVKAAIRVFREKGFHTATVREIGAAANLTQGTIYNYVRSKDDILYLVCDSVVTAYQDSVRRALATDEPQPLRMESAIRALIEVMYEHQDDILLLYHESHALERRSLHAILARVAEFHRFVEDTICKGIDTDRIGIDRALLTNILTYLPTIVAQRRWLLGRTVPKQQVIEGLVRFIMQGTGFGAGASEAATPADRPTTSPASNAKRQAYASG